MHLQPDTLLQGRYRVVRLIAQGGMGAVYEAVDTRLGSTVALKQTLMADPDLREAFEREARLLAALHHPALPVVSDHFSEDGGQFLVMQYIPGEDLASLLRARGAPFPTDQVLAWAGGILDALGYLHGRQPPVIHRDIKPQNLKLAPHGGIILLDFGLAKGVAAGLTGPSPSLFGYTPQYAPIEQIQGSGTDARSDLYSLAATLAELLTGTPPADALTRVAATVRGQPDPLRPVMELNPAVPAHVSAAIERSLALNPAMRHPTAAALRADLLAQPSATTSPGGAAGTPDLQPNTVASRQEAVTGPTVAVGAAPPPTAPTGAVREGRSLPGPFVLGAIVLALLVASAIGTLVAFRGSTAEPTAVTGPATATPPTGVASGGSTTAPATPDTAGASFADPVRFGQEGVFGSLRVRVLDNQRGRDAWNAMRQANSFNDPPPEGYEYFLVKLSLELSTQMGGFYPRIAGDRRVLYAPTAFRPRPCPTP